MEEFNQRLDAIFAAKTQSQLTAITSDLPHVSRAVGRRCRWPQRAPAGTRPARPAPPAPGPAGSTARRRLPSLFALAAAADLIM